MSLPNKYCKFCGSSFYAGPNAQYCSLFCIFWSHVPVEIQPNGCVLWNGPCSARGYGYLRFRGREVRASRVCLLLHGIDVDGLDAAHLCETPPCVAFEHLQPNTRSQNMLYAYRSRYARSLV